MEAPMTAPTPPPAPGAAIRAPSAKRRKYRPGRMVNGLEAAELILNGRFLYFNDKPMHHGWMQNWSLRQLEVAGSLGRLRVAERNAP
jgi:hypothetical protein